MKICNIITGSIAAYKQIDLLRALQDLGHSIEIILTKGGEHFVPPLVLETFFAGRVWSDDVFAKEEDGRIRHIRLAQETDLFLIAPATADFLAKMASGQADTLALATLLATRKPLLIAPAMNPQMWCHPATQENVRSLKRRGFEFLGPVQGQVACGDWGEGKYIDEEILVSSLTQKAHKKETWKSKHVLITLGATREYFDPVRYLGNLSSGQTGVALAKAFLNRGAQVTLVCGSVTVDLPEGCRIFHGITAQKMLSAVESSLPADVMIGCAAVCDYRPRGFQEKKIKKSSQCLPLDLEPNVDVIKTVATSKNRPACVIGFALESEQGPLYADKKQKEKHLNGVVLNEVKHLGTQENVYHLFSKKGERPLGLLTKEALGNALIEALEEGFFQET